MAKKPTKKRESFRNLAMRVAAERAETAKTKGDQSGWTAANIMSLARQARRLSWIRDAENPKKPARRFVVGYGVSVWGASPSVYGSMPVTKVGASKLLDALAKREGKSGTIYELVPVAGGRTKP